jgi:trehalose-phosphatase
MTGLSSQLVAALGDFARRDRVLVAVDFDGTLAPIVEDPDAAQPLLRSVDALKALAGLPDTHAAVISGRPLARLRRFMAAADGLVLVGSHGAEISDHDPLDADERQLLARVRAAVCDVVAAYPGTWLEDKPAAVVLHTRTADREQAAAATDEAIDGPGNWPGVHVLRGKEVVELAVTDASKGRALRQLRAELGLDHGGVLFAGDDATDERAFAELDDDRGDLTVKVGHGQTAARYRVEGPRDVADVLTLLVGRRVDRRVDRPGPPSRTS